MENRTFIPHIQSIISEEKSEAIFTQRKNKSDEFVLSRSMRKILGGVEEKENLYNN